MRSFGTDRLESGPGATFRLECRMAKGWIARKPGTLTRPEFPGTAVRWEERIFEVIEALPLPEGGVAYRLALWEDRHTIRVVESYDAEAEEARLAEQRRRRRAVAARRWSLALAPLLGHLPGPVQRRMEGEFGAPARAMTIVSALPLLVLGTLGLLAAVVAAFGGGGAFRGWPILPVPLALFLFVESAARLGVAFLLGDPMGSLAGTALYGLWRGLRETAGRARRRYAPDRASKGKENA
ncbi:MAG: hypothetical protein ACRD3M_00605 [Thermoanaerobaculia bacterium]